MASLGVPLRLSLMVLGLIPALANSSISLLSPTPRMQLVMRAVTLLEWDRPKRSWSSSAVIPTYGSKRFFTKVRRSRSFSASDLGISRMQSMILR